MCLGLTLHALRQMQFFCFLWRHSGDVPKSAACFNETFKRAFDESFKPHFRLSHRNVMPVKALVQEHAHNTYFYRHSGRQIPLDVRISSTLNQERLRARQRLGLPSRKATHGTIRRLCYRCRRIKARRTNSSKQEN